MQDTTQIKRRRLTAEVQTLNQLISDTQDMIKYDPYPQDIPSLTTQLINARADLAQALGELDQSRVIDRMQELLYAQPKVGNKEARRIVAELQAKR